MLVPVLPLMFGRTIFDQPALATDEAVRGWRVGAVSTALRTLGTLTAFGISLGFLSEDDIAVYPVAHLLGFDLFPVSAATFYRENHCPFDAPPGEADHFTIIVATGVWASAREVEEDIFCRYKERVREENLGVGRRLMREQDDKRGLFFV